jgi:hypothetical protein
MAKSAPIKTGSAADLADQSFGYSPNGESQHSRRSAKPPRMLGHVKKRNGRHTLLELILEQTSLIAGLRGEILLETNARRREKLQRNFEIKTAFLARLQREQDQ